jgi:transcriptional regulator with XRE-family HTH domain
MMQIMHYPFESQMFRLGTFAAVEWLLKQIRQALNERGWSNAEFGRRMGMRDYTINRRMSDGNFTLDELVKAQGLLDLRILNMPGSKPYPESSNTTEGNILEEPSDLVTKQISEGVKITIELGSQPMDNEGFVKKFAEALQELENAKRRKRNSRE